LILKAAVLFLASAGVAAADCPCEPKPTPPLTGSVGAGLALTGGNTDTKTVNVTAGLQWDPKTGNVLKASGLYLHGEKDDEDILSQTTLGARDEYHFGPRAFVFGDLSYLHDQFKQISYLIAPLAGVGYQLAKTPALVFAVDAGAGGAFEKDEGLESTSNGALHAGETLTWKISPTATLSHSATGLWKTSDTADALYHLDAAIATQVTRHSELKVSFVDEIKNRPPSPSLKKSDTAIVATFLMKL
jgi:putative salt-induced outer membrane protein YdiY